MEIEIIIVLEKPFYTPPPQDKDRKQGIKRGKRKN